MPATNMKTKIGREKSYTLLPKGTELRETSKCPPVDKIFQYLESMGAIVHTIFDLANYNDEIREETNTIM
mgnify:CR=1 FL=1